MKTLLDNIDEISSEALEKLKKFLAEKPEELTNDQGAIIDEVLFMVLTGELPYSVVLNSKIHKDHFYELLHESTEFKAITLQKDHKTKKKDFQKPSKNGSNFIMIIDDAILISCGINVNCIYYRKNTDIKLINSILEKAQNSRKEKKAKENHFNMITKGQYGDGLCLQQFKIKPYDVDITMHYNDDFLEIDSAIKNFLNNPDGNGLVLLHGKPGTGKTSYIRHLIKTLDKRVIYLPTHLMDVLSDPGFLEFIAEYNDSVLVLEDCEDILKPRHGNSMTNPSLGNLLNLGDGLLSDALCIKVICTFNADIHKIDRAILRKGRLVARYEFCELSVEKSQYLLAHLDKKHETSEPMTLADLYNVGGSDFSKVQSNSKIGFDLN